MDESFFWSIIFMLISDDYKNNYDTVPTTGNNSMGLDTKATQSYSTLAFGKGLETYIFFDDSCRKAVS